MKKLLAFLTIFLIPCFFTAGFIFAQADSGKLDGKWEVEPSEKKDGKELQFQLRSSKFQGDNQLDHN